MKGWHAIIIMLSASLMGCSSAQETGEQRYLVREGALTDSFEITLPSGWQALKEGASDSNAKVSVDGAFVRSSTETKMYASLTNLAHQVGSEDFAKSLRDEQGQLLRRLLKMPGSQEIQAGKYHGALAQTKLSKRQGSISPGYLLQVALTSSDGNELVTIRYEQDTEFSEKQIDEAKTVCSTIKLSVRGENIGFLEPPG